MPHFVSTTNLWILAVGIAIVVLNVVSSTRLAPVVARLFARLGHHAELPPPSRRSV
ncbi:MAG TPA: hypothetical protein VIF15_04650 [Polyangiaceae bacterium]|jgi:hypothetical protein